MKIVIIPGLTLREVADDDLARIQEVAGHNAQVVVADVHDAVNHVEDAEVILGFVPKALFEVTRKLRWAQSISAGVDMFFYPEFVESDVILTSEKGLVGEHLADHAFGLLLMLTRQLATALKHGTDSWNHRAEMRYQEIELTGLTLGLYGFGGTGRAIAKRGVAFGMNCIALDRDPVAPGNGVDEVWDSSRFSDLLAASDVLSICCPLTNETRNAFDAVAYSKMKESAFLVNVTRGEVMEEDALVNALQTGQIRGAALDVAPREPLPADSPLWSMPNVVMTPHTAGASQFRAERNMERFIRNLRRFLADEPLEGVIDKHLGY